jgi:hypothetical protein
MLSCRTKSFNEQSSLGSAPQAGQTGTEDIKQLLAENSPQSRAAMVGYLDGFLRDLEASAPQDKPKGDFEFLMTSAQVTRLSLSRSDKEICSEEEKITLYRGLPAHSLSSTDPQKAVIVARGFSNIGISYAQVMRNYARAVTDPKEFGQSSPPPGSNQLAAAPPFSFHKTGSRHSLAIAARESPYISFSVSPSMAGSFAPKGGFVATVRVCPARMWSSTEGAFASEGEFLLPMATLPGEITALTPVAEANTDALSKLSQSILASCFFENPGVGDTGIFKETSARVLTDFNLTVLQLASKGTGTVESYDSIDFANPMRRFTQEKCNCTHQVEIFRSIAKGINEERKKSGEPLTFVPGESFCQEFGATQ